MNAILEVVSRALRAVLKLVLVRFFMAVIVFAQYYRMTLRSRWPLALFLSPYIVWQELYLLLSSVVGYKRGTITWKGRVVKRPTRKRTLL